MRVERRVLETLRRRFPGFPSTLRRPTNVWYFLLATYSAQVLVAAIFSNSVLHATLVPLVLFVPGYAVVVAGLTKISPSEKAVLAFGLSVALFAAFHTAVRLGLPSQDGTSTAVSALALVSLLVFGFKCITAFRKSQTPVGSSP